MKIFKILPKFFGGAVFAALSFTLPHATAVPVTFSGGSGTPLSMTLTDPMTYLITGNAAIAAPLFIFQNTGNVVGGNDMVTGDISVTINGGPPQAIHFMTSGASTGVITPNDLILQGPTPGVSIGDIIVLSSGTITTTANTGPAAPLSAMYNTFIADGFGNVLSGPGISSPVSGVPDSGSTWTLLLLGLTAMFGVKFLVRRPA